MFCFLSPWSRNLWVCNWRVSGARTDVTWRGWVIWELGIFTSFPSVKQQCLNCKPATTIMVFGFHRTTRRVGQKTYKFHSSPSSSGRITNNKRGPHHSTAGLKGTGQPSSNQLSSSEPDKVNFIEVLINYLSPAALTHCGFRKLWPALLRSGFQKLWPVLRQTLLPQNLGGKSSWHCRSRHHLFKILKCILCIISKWWTDELWDGYSSGLLGQGIHHGLTLSPIDTSERIDASTSQYAGC